MRRCRERGAVREDSHISGSESGCKLVPFPEVERTLAKKPLREVKCRFCAGMLEEPVETWKQSLSRLGN